MARGYPISRYSTRLTFGGKKFKLIDHFSSKREAQRVRDQVKAIRKGNKARVVHSQFAWEVWGYTPSSRIGR